MFNTGQTVNFGPRIQAHPDCKTFTSLCWHQVRIQILDAYLLSVCARAYLCFHFVKWKKNPKSINGSLCFCFNTLHKRFLVSQRSLVPYWRLVSLISHASWYHFTIVHLCIFVSFPVGIHFQLYLGWIIFGQNLLRKKETKCRQSESSYGEYIGTCMIACFYWEK